MSDYGGSYSGFRLEQDGPVLTCLFNRPEVLNAYNPDIYAEISRLCKAVGLDKNIRVVIVTGEGSAFCVGGNVKKFVSGETDTALRFSAIDSTDALGSPTINRLSEMERISLRVRGSTM